MDRKGSSLSLLKNFNRGTDRQAVVIALILSRNNPCYHEWAAGNRGWQRLDVIAGQGVETLPPLCLRDVDGWVGSLPNLQKYPPCKDTIHTSTKGSSISTEKPSNEKALLTCKRRKSISLSPADVAAWWGTLGEYLRWLDACNQRSGKQAGDGR